VTLPQVLAIDADAGSHRQCLTALRAHAFGVTIATTASAARVEVEANRPDVILLDPDLPDMDGAELCRRLHVWPGAPIIAMTTDDTELTHLALFAAGADDVVLKPVTARLLVARIAVQLRHLAVTPDHVGELIHVGDLRIDTGAHQVRVADREVTVTRQQFTILRVLVHHVDAVVAPHVIARALGRSGSRDDLNAVRIGVSRLRRRIGQDAGTPRIVTERTGGYRLSTAASGHR
jgi:two-component system response regulator MtrA